MGVTVLRLGHRITRDKRITTHVCLVARAFGADKIILSGEKDEKIIDSILKVNKNWGMGIEIEYIKKWREVIKEHKRNGAILVHLTMYGEKVQDIISEIKTKQDLLVIVGGEKIPSEVYKESDYNVGITNQPHSEVAALAIFLDKYFNSKELELTFNNPKLTIKPNKFGKKIICGS